MTPAESFFFSLMGLSLLLISLRVLDKRSVIGNPARAALAGAGLLAFVWTGPGLFLHQSVVSREIAKLAFFDTLFIAVLLFVVHSFTTQSKSLARALEHQRAAEAELTRHAAAVARAAVLDQVAAIVESSNDAIVGMTLDGNIVSWNAAAKQIFGFSEDEAVGHHIRMIFPDHGLDELDHMLRKLADGETIRHHETIRRRKDGTLIDASVSVSPIRDSAGNITGMSSIIRDISEAREMHEMLNRQAERMIVEAQKKKSERRFRALVQSSSDVITIVDRDLRVIYQSPAMDRVFGYKADELVGRPLLQLIHSEDVRRITHALTTGLTRPGVLPLLKCRVLHRDGGWRHTESAVTNLLDDTDVNGIILNTRDVSERKQAEDELAHRALHDALTGLPNRVLLADRLQMSLSRLRRSSATLAVLFLDLDGFKTINDGLGHDTGDRLLIEVAKRLTADLRTSDTAARFGGDEFVVLCEEIRDEAEALAIAERVANSILEPVVIDGRELFITTSVGIAIARNPEVTAEELIRDADAAMYRAKGAGRGRCELFDEEMRLAVVARLEGESDLRRAIDRGELDVYYQPQVDLTSGALAGVEALLRWHHPERGMISPAEFIPLAEETGLIIDIGRFALRTACAQAADWHAKYPAHRQLKMSVNLSAKQLQQSSLIDEVADALLEWELDPTTLMLELTETSLIEDMDSNVTRLEELLRLGVKIAIDDFGTGYSSLNYLRRFPVDILKIDRSFVQGVAGGPEEAGLARAIIKLAQDLRLTTVAEGIETLEEATTLRGWGCDIGQGYLFARPLPAAEMEDVLGPLSGPASPFGTWQKPARRDPDPGDDPRRHAHINSGSPSSGDDASA